MVIPYTSTVRADTGVYNAKLGIWLFLASEVMLFGGLFSAYIFLRMSEQNWPRGSEYLNVWQATANTIVLITSSITMVMSWASLVMGRLRRYRLFMGATVLLAAVFLVSKGFEYAADFAHGMFPSTNTFLAIYFTLTGIHGLHVVGGMAVNLYQWGPGSRVWRADPARFTNRVEVAGLYWHFVDLVWIVLFPVVYLL
jgi:cytochrome c oxidase subunit 3